MRFIESSIEKDIKYLKSSKNHKLQTSFVEEDKDMLKDMKEALDVAEVDFQRTEEFFRKFKAEKLKVIHNRIKENQQYLRSTMRILHTDKEAFVKMLGFDQEERRIILNDIFQSY